MNINEVDGHNHGKQLSTARKVGGNKGFDQILDDAVRGAVPEEHAGDEVSAPRRVDFPPLLDRGLVEHSVLQHAYDVLDLLEEYSQALHNSHMTLKAIEPILTRIEQEVKGLEVQSGANVAQDDELAGIVNEIAVTARLEALKFQRGDYIT